MINDRQQGSNNSRSMSIAMSVVAFLVITLAIIIILYSLRPVDNTSITQIIRTPDNTGITSNGQTVIQSTSGLSSTYTDCLSDLDCQIGYSCIRGYCQPSNSQVLTGCQPMVISDILSDMII